MIDFRGLRGPDFTSPQAQAIESEIAVVPGVAALIISRTMPVASQPQTSESAAQVVYWTRYWQVRPGYRTGIRVKTEAPLFLQKSLGGEARTLD